MNPSLPVARSLVSRGHEVHYFTHESVRKVVESTGAVFHSVVDYHGALSDGRFAADSPIGIFAGLVEKHGLKPTGANTGHAVLPFSMVSNVAGPGGYADHMTAGVGEEEWVASMQGFAPHVEATARLNATYGLGLAVVERPLMMLESARVHLVTTSESLQDPMGPELAQAYAGQGAEFAYVGPLLEEGEGS